MRPNELEGIREAVFDNDRAVSPVIGVILMVAITVILAAVIGTFVLGLGQDVGKSAPQASLSVSASSSSGNVTIDHTGGDSLHSDRTRIIVETSSGSSVTYDPTTADALLSVGNDARVFSGGVDFNGNGTGHAELTTAAPTINSGDTVTVELIDTDTQRVIFQSEVTAS